MLRQTEQEAREFLRRFQIPEHEQLRKELANRLDEAERRGVERATQNISRQLENERRVEYYSI